MNDLLMAVILTVTLTVLTFLVVIMWHWSESALKPITKKEQKQFLDDVNCIATNATPREAVEVKPHWQFQYSFGLRIVFGIAFNNMDAGNLKHRSISMWFGPFACGVWHELWEKWD